VNRIAAESSNGMQSAPASKAKNYVFAARIQYFAICWRQQTVTIWISADRLKLEHFTIGVPRHITYL